MSDEVRDRRERGWSWFDNGVIDHFGPVIGAYGIAVYMVLVRYSDAKTQECFPSQATLAKELRVSKQTVWRTIQKLVDVGIVKKRRRKTANGDYDSTIYTLVNTWAGVVPVGNNPKSTELPVNVDKTQEVVPVGNNVVPSGNEGCSPQEQGVVPVGSTNKTQYEQDSLNKEKEIPPVTTNVVTSSTLVEDDRPAQPTNPSKPTSQQRFQNVPTKHPYRKPSDVPRYDPEGFRRFYDAYPCKKDRPAAMKAWDKLRPDEELQHTITADLQTRRAADREWVEGYICHPATYLNGRRWQDEMTPLNQARAAARRPQETAEEKAARQARIIREVEEGI